MRKTIWIGLNFAAVTLLGAGAVAQTGEPFKGKQIRMVIASGSGGGYDTYARALGRHMAKHIPGEPLIIYQNMPGAGGITAANWTFNIAPKDGTVILAPFNLVMFEPLFGNKSAKYDPRKFEWLGSVDKQPAVCVAWKDSGITSLADAKTREVIMAGSGAGSNSVTTPKIINEMVGTKFKVISGYGTTEGRLAVERGEAQGLCQAWGTLKTTVPGWLQSKQVNFLVQTGSSRNKDLPDTPLLSDLVESAQDKAVLKLLNLPEDVGRVFIMPPGTPPEMVAILRKAFDATMVDPDFAADARKVAMDIDPVAGADIQRLLNTAYEAPPAIIERATKLLDR